MENQKTIKDDAEEKKNPLTTVIVSGVGLFSILVLLFPSVLPDFIPIVGAIDEAVATTLLISVMAYFGVDLGSLFGRKKAEKDSDIIDIDVE